ncbi:MAG: NAD(P)-binding domain-containing protein [Clostridia bacterium]|nr:NAD(P)-binding domain-containing protein [Clostridia bacterium]
MKKIVIIGAGKTGRGFIGRLVAEAGREILFIDKDAALVDALNREGSFGVAFFGGVRPAFRVSGYKAVTWEEADLTDAEVIFVSVGGQNLPDVGAALSARLADEEVPIITCENASHPSRTLGDALGKGNPISEATVFCTTIEGDGLSIHSENYPYLQCNAELLRGYVPTVPSVRAIPNFADFLTRKLYTYNAASCVIAYVGALLGYSDYGEAANDPRILALMDKNYAATNAAMCARFGYDPADQREFAALSKAKFTDRTIVDTIARNAREPHRKLGGSERIIGAAKLLREYGEDSAVLELTAAAALLYTDPKDAKWTALRESLTPAGILSEIASLPETDPLAQAILTRVDAIQANLESAIGDVLR